MKCHICNYWTAESGCDHYFPEITYQVTKESKISNAIVKELNAKVLTATFQARGLVMADLYSGKEGNYIVAAGTCAPVHTSFVKKVRIDLKTASTKHQTATNF